MNIDYINEKVDLCYMVNGTCKEVIKRNQTRRQLAFTKRKLETTTHRLGKLVYLKTGSHKY